MKTFLGRVGIIQRVLPQYRAPFFDKLAGRCEGGLSVFAGEARSSEAIKTAENLQVAQHFPAENHHYLSGAFYLCKQAGMQEWLETWQPEALIVEANPRYLSSRKAVRWMKAQARPVIAWGLGSGRGGGLLAVLSHPLRRNFLNDFDAVIAYSQEGLDSFAALGLDDLKLFHAANAVVDAPQQEPDAIDVQGKPRVLFVGRLQARKGLERLIGASQSVQSTWPHELRIVGDGPEMERLQNLATRYFNESIHFTGALYGAELEQEFRQAELFVLPGTGGLAIQQAMGFGLPIIAGEGDGTQRDLLDSSNGWQLNTDEEYELTRVLWGALSNRESLHSKGLASYQKVKERFNLDAMTDVFVQALNEVSG